MSSSKVGAGVRVQQWVRDRIHVLDEASVSRGLEDPTGALVVGCHGSAALVAALRGVFGQRLIEIAAVEFRVGRDEAIGQSSRGWRRCGNRCGGWGRVVATRVRLSGYSRAGGCCCRCGRVFGHRSCGRCRGKVRVRASSRRLNFKTNYFLFFFLF